MLTVFPIHILETLTICLILLNIYRIFRHLSLENDNNGLPISIPEPNQNLQTLTNLHKESSGKLTPEIKSSTSNIEDRPSLKLAAPSASTLSASSKKQILHLPEKNEPHQTVLKNYIGDFF